MKRVTKLLCILSLFIASVASGAPPRFAGEVWAGSSVIPEAGPVNVYWVFDAGTFHEYVHYLRTDDTRLLSTGRYQVCPSTDGSDVYALQFMRMEQQVRDPQADQQLGTLQAQTVRIELRRTPEALTFPAGAELTRIDGYTEFVPPVVRATEVVTSSRKFEPRTNLYAGCCSDCYAVHAFFGLSGLNGICCGGGCGGGGGGSFGGGGATGGW